MRDTSLPVPETLETPGTPWKPLRNGSGNPSEAFTKPRILGQKGTQKMGKPRRKAAHTPTGAEQMPAARIY